MAFGDDNNYLILVADDDRGVRSALRRMLENEGFLVFEAEDGLQALSVYEIVRPHIVLLDCVMPGMDGISACARIKELPGGTGTPVLIISGLEDDQSVDSAFEAGASDFITKPINWAVLRNRLRRLLKARSAEETFEKTSRRLFDIIEFLPDATFVIDCESKVISWNKAIEEMTGIPKKDMLGKGEYLYAVPFYGKPRPLMIDLVNSGEDISDYQYRHIERKGNAVTAEVFAPFLKGIGAQLWVAVSLLFDKNGSRAGAIESIRDITDRKQMEERLKYLSLYDSLTQTYNRPYFEEEIRRLERVRNNPVSIIVCDVDGLKLVNESLGHCTGDFLLSRAAELIKKSFGSCDVVARIGGDEFAVLLPNCSRGVAEDFVARIKDCLLEYNSENTDLPISLSIGFATGTESHENIEKILSDADNSMTREKLTRSQSARSAIVRALMKALEERDYITEGHAERLQDLVVGLGTAVGLNQQRITELRLLARFHDIGKVGIPDRILFKKGRLTPEEFEEMKKHSEIGYRIAKSSPDLAPIAEWVLMHHEWWNGKGYPQGLKGEEIPLECRILAIADAYDAMTSDRPYRKAMTPKEAIRELLIFSGTQFDPELVGNFIAMRLLDAV